MSTTNLPPWGTSTALSIELLKKMLTIRELEQRALDLSRTTPPMVAGSIHLCSGQEAVAVGALAALGAEDQVVATYRGHGWALACGLHPVEVLGEICHRRAGINEGRGGSAYMMAPHRRFIGENSIVGAGLPIACGIAMTNRATRNGKVVLVSVGDGAFNQGSVHEALAFASASGLPLLIICENNGWSEMTPTSSTFKIDRIAKRAAGYGVSGVTIDGTDPNVVSDTVRRAADHARQGGGPIVIECRVPRLWGHYNRDIEHYRPRGDKEQAQARDPIDLLAKKLSEEGALDAEAFEKIRGDVRSEMDVVVETVLSSPEPDSTTARKHVYADACLNGAVNRADTSENREMTYIEAVNEALRRELSSRPNVIVYGEDVGVPGGIFGATKGLQKAFGSHRVFDTPIAESAILGSAVGAALTGMKPIVEIMWADFLLVALDQLVNQAANIRYVTSGRSGVPMVVRTQQGITPGSCAQHSQSLEALLAHVPGLRVAIPATPQDAYSLLRSAVDAEDPCIIFESRSLYQTSGLVQLSDEPEPIGKSYLRKSGDDAIIITWGPQVHTSMAAADMCKRQGIDVGVLDLRWLSPIDEEALMVATRNAEGRVIVVHEANRTGGFGAEVITRLHELLRGEIYINAIRVAAPDVRIPAAPILQKELAPTVEKISAAVQELLK